MTGLPSEAFLNCKISMFKIAQVGSLMKPQFWGFSVLYQILLNQSLQTHLWVLHTSAGFIPAKIKAMS